MDNVCERNGCNAHIDRPGRDFCGDLCRRIYYLEEEAVEKGKRIAELEHEFKELRRRCRSRIKELEEELMQ